MRIAPLIVVVGLGYLGYTYYINNKAAVDARIAALLGNAPPAAQEAAPGPADPSLPPPAPTPAPRVFESKIDIPETTPGQKALAPPGVFYMTERISAETATGIQAVNPGEQVRLLQRLPGGRMKVTLGAVEFIIKESQATNDLNAAQEAEKREFVSRGGKL